TGRAGRQRAPRPRQAAPQGIRFRFLQHVAVRLRETRGRPAAPRNQPALLHRRLQPQHARGDRAFRLRQHHQQARRGWPPVPGPRAVQERGPVHSTRFPWTPLWGRRGGPEEIGGMLTERQLNGSGELPERWSAKRKTEIVLRLLRGEDLGQISREIQVAPQVIEEWRRAFLAGAEAGLKKRGGDPLESELVRTRAKLGET